MPTVDWGRLTDDILDQIVVSEAVELDFGDRYQVGRVIGSGGQGTVYKCWDSHLGRAVAIKHLMTGGEEALLAEARLVNRFNHPGIPQLYDQGTCPDGSHFVVVQYIDGRPLHTHLAEEAPDLAQRLRIFRGLAGALSHAHAQGVLHRDLKPGNVLVTGTGEPYLVDWGLAACGDPRAVCGTPVFAAPEQLDGQVADVRSDVYALGVLLYFILSGHDPYQRRITDFGEFRRLRAGLQRVPLQVRRPDLPRYLGRICEIAMSAQPGARYRDVATMLDELDQAALTGKVARDDHRLPRLVLIALVGLVFVAGAVGGGGGVLLAERFSAPVPPARAPAAAEFDLPRLPEPPAVSPSRERDIDEEREVSADPDPSTGVAPSTGLAPSAGPVVRSDVGAGSDGDSDPDPDPDPEAGAAGDGLRLPEIPDAGGSKAAPRSRPGDLPDLDEEPSGR